MELKNNNGEIKKTFKVSFVVMFVFTNIAAIAQEAGKASFEKSCLITVTTSAGSLTKSTPGKIQINKEKVKVSFDKGIKIKNDETSFELTGMTFDLEKISGFELSKEGNKLFFHTCDSESCDKPCTIETKDAAAIMNKIKEYQKK